MTRRQRIALEIALGEIAKIARDLESAEKKADERGAAEAKSVDPVYASVVATSFKVGLLAATCTHRGRELRVWVENLCRDLKVTAKGF